MSSEQTPSSQEETPAVPTSSNVEETATTASEAAPATPSKVEPTETEQPTTEQPVADSASASVETTTPEASPAIAPATAQETTIQEGPAETTQPETTQQETAEQPAARPRVQLKPTIDPEAAKPKGTVAPAPPVASGETAEAGENASAADVSATVAPKAEPVDIPEASDIDDVTQAEIAAALASGDLDSVSTVVATTETEGEASESSAASATPAPAGETPVTTPPVSSTPKDESTLEPGEKLQGIVQSVHGEDIILNVGYRLDGLMNTKNFADGKVPKVGDTVDVVVDSVNQSEGLINVIQMTGAKKISGNWDAIVEGQIVECTVEKTNKGGLQVQISGLRGFMPASQIELGFVEDMAVYVGQKMQVKVLEVKPEKKNLVVSRKAILLEERKEAEAVAWVTLEEGQERQGTVKTLKDYGAFVDIGGVDGLLHVGEISWNRVNHPSDVLKVGQEITVKVISVDREKKKIGLGMKQMMANPWDLVETKFAQGTVVTGRVTKTTDFGAFVEIEEGVEGLVHISELDYKRVNQVTDVLKVNQEVEVQVLEVNKNKKRISLSVKALKPKPEAKEPRPKDEDLAPGQGQPYERKRKEPLKGGSSAGTGAGLFGNPSDFK